MTWNAASPSVIVDQVVGVLGGLARGRDRRRRDASRRTPMPSAERRSARARPRGRRSRSARTTAGGPPRRRSFAAGAGAVIGVAASSGRPGHRAARRAGGGAGGRPTGRRRARRWSRAASRRRGPRYRARSAATANRRPSSGPSASVRSAAEAMCAHRHHEDVRRRLRVDVPDRDHEVVLVEPRRRDLARDDPAEQAVSGHRRLRASITGSGVSQRVWRRVDREDLAGHAVRGLAVDRGSPHASGSRSRGRRDRRRRGVTAT